MSQLAEENGAYCPRRGFAVPYRYTSLHHRSCCLTPQAAAAAGRGSRQPAARRSPAVRRVDANAHARYGAPRHGSTARLISIAACAYVAPCSAVMSTVIVTELAGSLVVSLTYTPGSLNTQRLLPNTVVCRWSGLRCSMHNRHQPVNARARANRRSYPRLLRLALAITSPDRSLQVRRSCGRVPGYRKP